MSRISLRPAEDRDIEPIAALLTEPAVARWWPRYDRARVAAELAESPEEWHAVELAETGALIGTVLLWEESDPDYRHGGIDIGLATAHHGRGLGREAMRAAVDRLIDERGHHRVTIDPSARNERAIRCYTAVGFRPVGIMRRYSLGPDGEWEDGLLMDLLADERPWR